MDTNILTLKFKLQLTFCIILRIRSSIITLKIRSFLEFFLKKTIKCMILIFYLLINMSTCEKKFYSNIFIPKFQESLVERRSVEKMK